MHETFWTLLRDSAHWEFELFLMLLFDGVIFGICWPFLRKHWKHHIDRDRAVDASPVNLSAHNNSSLRYGVDPSLWPGQPPFEGAVGVQINSVAPNEWKGSRDGWDSWG